MQYDNSIVSGDVAEWLGSALQKLLQRFESARHLLILQSLFRNEEAFCFIVFPFRQEIYFRENENKTFEKYQAIQVFTFSWSRVVILYLD